MMKKLLAFLLIFVLTLSVIPIAAESVAVSAQAISSGYVIESFLQGDKAYFFLPTVCDIEKVSLITYAEDGAEVSRQKDLDFSKENNATIELKGVKYAVVVMKSELPSLVFSIKEEYGKIRDMHASEDHSAYCYGNVSLVVSQRDSEKKGWAGFDSQENDDTTPGTVKIRGRGNSTWEAENPDAKKPYQFKLEKGEDILGMGKNKTWVLLKNDQHIIKNKLGLDLGKRMGIEFSLDSEFVDVFMNGVYLGNYLLSEKIEVDKDRVNISDLDSEFKKNNNSTKGLDLTGGYLVEIDFWGDGDIKFNYKLPKNESIWYVIKSPEELAAKATYKNAYSYIGNLMNGLLDAVYTDGKMPDGRSYLEYIDVDNFVRYFFHQEFLKNFDVGRSSTYFYKDKDSIDSLIHAGPVWDHDRIFESGGATGWALQTICYPYTTVETFYNKLGRRLDFVALLIDAYENTDIPDILKQSPELVDTYIEDIGVSGEMNRIRWNFDRYNPWKIKQYMVDRATWIDENYTSLLDVARDDGITVLVNDRAVIFDVKPFIKGGRTLVPIRAIFEALGAEVDWQAETNTAIAQKGDTTVKITINKDEMYVNDSIKKLDVPAMMKDERTVIPLRAVSEAFNCTVDWNAKTQIVSITY